jgi:hypothetical protein
MVIGINAPRCVLSGSLEELFIHQAFKEAGAELLKVVPIGLNPGFPECPIGLLPSPSFPQDFQAVFGSFDKIFF